jgi:hypothetical protein
MKIETNTDFYRAILPKDPGAAYRFIRETAPQLLSNFDKHVLHGYDLGKYFKYHLDSIEEISDLRINIFEEARAVAVGKAMPTLPLDRVNSSEMHLYALRGVFNILLHERADNAWAQQEGYHVPEEYFRGSSAVLSELYLVMMRLIKHATGKPIED